MELIIGNNIKRLRREKDVTQEDFAELLGVSSQSVSRWENGVCYPDMELIPAIANYFGVSVDELFGCQYDREKRIEAIIAKVDAMDIGHDGDDGWVDEAVAILREGLAEFPGNEKLLITLAETLSEAGWRRHKEWVYYNEEGFMRHDYDVHLENPYWKESVRICERLAASTSDSAISMRAVTILVLLYRNFGENEKARAWAQRMPELRYCRELMLASASDGKEEAKYIGEFLLKAAREFAEQLVYGLVVNKRHYESDMPIDKIKGLIALFDLICDDGNYGRYNDMLIKLHLYLSRLQWERGYHDEAFVSLDKALYHAKELEKVVSKSEHCYTAPLVAFVKDKFDAPAEAEPGSIARQLPDDWPFWCNPDYSEVEKEIKADPRWDAWVKKTQV